MSDNLSQAAERAAQSIAEKAKAEIFSIPTTDTERIAIMVHVGELLSDVPSGRAKRDAS